MSTSMMRSGRVGTWTEGVLGVVWRRARGFVSAVLFGDGAVQGLDARDVDSYFRTTDG